MLEEKMKKFLAFLLFLFVVMCLGVGVQAYTVTPYYNYVSWLNAIGVTPVNENFEDTIFEPGFSITETGYSGWIHDGVYQNIVDKDVPSYQVFNYSFGMSAFGGFLDLYNPGGAGTSIDVYINDDNQYVFNVPNTAAGEFYGFVTDTIFYGVRFEDGGGAGVQETYYGIDLSLAPNRTPELSSLILLGLGLIGTGFFVRRK
jgi:hypothetical protein